MKCYHPNCNSSQPFWICERCGRAVCNFHSIVRIGTEDLRICLNCSEELKKGRNYNKAKENPIMFAHGRAGIVAHIACKCQEQGIPVFKEIYRAAFELQRWATQQETSEPLRSISCLRAARYALEAEMGRQAGEMLVYGLSKNPPEKYKLEMVDMLREYILDIYK